jgi:hypothetical protein
VERVCSKVQGSLFEQTGSSWRACGLPASCGPASPSAQPGQCVFPGSCLANTNDCLIGSSGYVGQTYRLTLINFYRSSWALCPYKELHYYASGLLGSTRSLGSASRGPRRRVRSLPAMTRPHSLERPERTGVIWRANEVQGIQITHGSSFRRKKTRSRTHILLIH